jgi:putative nucleotidyltransferase with HDIG domain
MLRKAPGTYQHSLQVANLAELAAEQIGANATLVRVGAMYHDIGKTLNPQFFVENQTAGVNPHDELHDPYRSAQLIIGHVAEGIRLARLHRLPERIRDFIREHHGTSKPMYFYYRALELADGDTDEIDIKAFTYPGPRPKTKETAILMLADGTESTARAVNPRTHEEIEDVVNKTFERALEDGQLDESNLTLNDLKAIREVFIETLQGIYHQRIAYTAPKVKAEATTTPQLEEGKETVEEEFDKSPIVTDTNEIVVDDLELDSEVESDIEAIIKPGQPSTEKTSKEASPSKAKTRTQEIKSAQITPLEGSNKSSSSTNAEASASEQDGEEANEDEDA